MLRHSVEGIGLSERTHDKILRVVRTIADLAGIIRFLRCTWPNRSAIGLSIENCGSRTHQACNREVWYLAKAASRGLTNGVPALKLPDTYFQDAGAVSQEQAKRAGLRLSRILNACVEIAGR